MLPPRQSRPGFRGRIGPGLFTREAFGLARSPMFSLHHAALSVSDLERSESFYGLFGFRPVHRWSAPDGSLTIVHMQLGPTLLELFSYRDHQPAPESSRSLATDLPRLGTKHFALGVDDMDQARSCLLARGLDQVPLLSVPKTNFASGIFFLKQSLRA